MYSFGVVLVELLTGQKPVSSIRTNEGRSLATYFIISMEENRLLDILDAPVLEQGRSEQIIALANLAKRCLNLKGKKRPTMREVVIELEGIQSLVLRDSKTEQNQENRNNMEAETSEGIGTQSALGVSDVKADVTSLLDVPPLLPSETW